MTKNSFVIVSNRLPVSVSKEDGKLKFNVSSGGLATAMSSLDTGEDRVWIGWPGIASDDLTPADKVQITRELKKHNCVPVHLSREQINLFYEGYANDTLWPLFHYFQSLAQYSGEYWQSYKDVNALFSQAVKRSSTPDATIWVQDYHFMLLPALLRKALPESSIGFFLHIPFPSYEIFRLLPERREILEGLLGADLLGFHIYDYARHFTSSCVRTLGATAKNGIIHYDGRVIKVDAFPIGIDYKKFRSTIRTAAFKDELATLKENYDGQKVMLSVDRLDYSKGILNRLEGFRAFLQQNPSYIKKVKLVMVAVPSRTEVETYKQLRDTIEQTVSRINGEFATVDWTPISYQFQNLPFEKVVALYNYADVALVTPIRDGMNLVAKEYVASKTKDRPGVLILSEMAGAIDELPEVLNVNPNNTQSLADAIKKAFRMSKRERLSRQEAMQKRIASYTVQRWGADFIEELEAMRDERNIANKKRLTSSDLQQMLSDFQDAGSRLVMLDYDGTLQTFKKSPRASLAAPSKQLLNVIRKIAEKPNTTVCIISGRKKSALDSWFGKMPVSLVAEHGAWFKHNGEWTQIDSNFDDEKKSLLPILEKYTSRTAGAIIEEKDYALVWHYRNVPTELAYIRKADLKRELQAELAESEIGVFEGRSIIEVKPKEVHKGNSARELHEAMDADFVLCAGDDYTDEDMFEALPASAYTIKVGSDETAARFRVSGVERMVAVLSQIAKL